MDPCALIQINMYVGNSASTHTQRIVHSKLGSFFPSMTYVRPNNSLREHTIFV